MLRSRRTLLTSAADSKFGHSFFVPRRGEPVAPDWRRRVVETEIRPLLEEYWSETPEKVEHWCGRLVE